MEVAMSDSVMREVVLLCNLVSPCRISGRGIFYYCYSRDATYVVVRLARHDRDIPRPPGTRR